MSRPVAPEINVIGHISAGTGLGVAARNLIRAMLKRGIAVHALDLDPGGGRRGADNRFDSITVSGAQELPWRHNLFVLPAHAIADHANELKDLMLRTGCLNAAFPFWELPQVPEVDRLVLESLDVVVSGSEFIRHAFDFSVSGVRNVTGMQPIEIPAGRPDRTRFGLPKDGVIFVFSFEPLSCLVRKNPYAVVDAFLQAVSNDPDAHLVIKMNNAHQRGQELKPVQELRRYVADHPRITLITETLSHADLMSLFASCDVFVSLHRAEGLGLGMLEAMLLGKPVIATAWSGNMTFMRDTNACLVGYRLIPTHGTIMQYQQPYIPKGTMWADPSIEEAGGWMRRLLDDDDLRRAKGEAARRDAAAYCAEAERCDFVDDLLEIAHYIDPKTVDERRKNLPERLHRIQKLMNPVTTADVAKRAWSRIRGPLDRHLLWRFNADNRIER